MRKALLGGAPSIITFAAATPATPKESRLVPPAQSTGESRQEDVQTCISQARVADRAHGALGKLTFGPMLSLVGRLQWATTRRF